MGLLEELRKLNMDFKKREDVKATEYFASKESKWIKMCKKAASRGYKSCTITFCGFNKADYKPMALNRFANKHNLKLTGWCNDYTLSW